MTLGQAVERLNAVKSFSRRISQALVMTRGVALALLLMSLWSLVRPGADASHLILGAAAMIAIGLSSMQRRKRHKIGLDEVALALEIRHGDKTKRPLDTLRPEDPAPADWVERLDEEVRALRRFERQRIGALASTLVLPLAAAFAALPSAAPSFELAMEGVSSVVSRMTRGATLKVVVGMTEEKQSKPVELSTSKPEVVELLAQNLVEVSLTGGGFGKTPPTVELRRPPGSEPETPEEPKKAPQGGTLFQSFQMMPVRDASDVAAEAEGEEADDATRHAISFAVSEEVELYIPALSGDKPLATLKVRQPPIPKVKLSALTAIEDPWPDDQPLPLRITVKAEHPLDSVRLLIKSGNRVSKELVANVVSEDKLELTTDYKLVLETYVESDLAQVEIVAEAIDRAVPTPLIGLSEPLKLNTASAYGRYRQTLQTLREMKQLVDDAVAKQEKQLPPEARALAAKAEKQSEKSPFFDGLDRMQISRFSNKTDELAAQPEMEKTMELSSTLNDFLFEHEILDDRERDRDFFVAARGLSRIVEQEQSRRPVPLKTVTDRVRKFLDDRYERWQRRTARLDAASQPAKWPEVRDQKPFHAAMDKVEKLDETAGKSQQAKSDQLTALSRAVVEYRQWIEELEAAEDKARDQEDKQRQEGLANARDALRELQKRQGEISQELDRAGQRNKGDMEAQWPTSRMKQNTNARDTKRLESQMRSLSPSASARVEAAVQAMEGVIEQGNQGGYAQAESDSDLAGRLLRQADSAAQQSQQKRKARGRRRRVTGDNYYGQSVIGGDVEIKREYQVDRRYREDILDEVQNAGVDADDRQLLETYLRQVVR
jgi:hypothetical protein